MSDLAMIRLMARVAATCHVSDAVITEFLSSSDSKITDVWHTELFEIARDCRVAHDELDKAIAERLATNAE